MVGPAEIAAMRARALQTPYAARRESKGSGAERVSAQSNMGIGAVVFVVGGLVTLGSGGHIVAWGAILFGAVQFFIGLSQAGSGPSGKLGELLPEGSETQRAICAALCGVVQNPQQLSEAETQHIQHLLAQVQFPQTPERIHAVAKAVGDARRIARRAAPDVECDRSQAAPGHPRRRLSGDADGWPRGRHGKDLRNWQVPVPRAREGRRVARALQQAAATAAAAPIVPSMRHIVQRGTVNDSAYHIYSNGTVEYDSMIGLKIFPTEREFRAFVT